MCTFVQYEYAIANSIHGHATSAREEVSSAQAAMSITRFFMIIDVVNFPLFDPLILFLLRLCSYT